MRRLLAWLVLIACAVAAVFALTNPLVAPFTLPIVMVAASAIVCLTAGNRVDVLGWDLDEDDDSRRCR